jgi:hypothetical protein
VVSFVTGDVAVSWQKGNAWRESEKCHWVPLCRVGQEILQSEGWPGIRSLAHRHDSRFEMIARM